MSNTCNVYGETGFICTNILTGECQRNFSMVYKYSPVVITHETDKMFFLTSAKHKILLVVKMYETILYIEVLHHNTIYSFNVEKIMVGINLVVIILIIRMLVTKN